MERWFLSLIVLSIFFLGGVASIKCYSCNYPDTKCGDRFAYTNPDANECSGSCVKRRGIRPQGGVEVYRGCQSQTTTYCHETTYVEMSVVECFCNEEYCNNSNSVRMSALSLILAIISILYNTL
ncbi:protein quiver-like [Ylistrum balloti]|uniref:protein quiver-like n=1 Tax=Ylistrum balloti TaxID=509963 RepID=UPI002905850B|nr:protein quiver-like [Ylistrum balloti]